MCSDYFRLVSLNPGFNTVHCILYLLRELLLRNQVGISLETVTQKNEAVDDGHERNADVVTFLCFYIRI